MLNNQNERELCYAVRVTDITPIEGADKVDGTSTTFTMLQAKKEKDTQLYVLETLCLTHHRQMRRTTIKTLTEMFMSKCLKNTISTRF